MLEVVYIPVIVFGKSDLINGLTHVYLHEIRQFNYFKHKTQGTDKLKTGRQQVKNLNLAAYLKRKNIQKCEKFCISCLRYHY